MPPCPEVPAREPNAPEEGGRRSAAPVPGPSRVFLSYSRADRYWLERLEKHLKPFGDRIRLATWADDRIQPGQLWEDEIRKAIGDARLAVLLVSPDFLASDFIVKQELPLLIEAAAAGRLTLVWFHLRSSSYAETAVAAYQSLVDPKCPLASLKTEPEQDELLVRICQRMIGALNPPAAIGSPAVTTADASLPRPISLEISPTRLRHGADRLVGREEELALLDTAWETEATHVVVVVAWGGVGKTSLVVEWMARKAAANWPLIERVFDWSFYSQGTRQQGSTSTDSFIGTALEFFGGEEGRTLANSPASPREKGTKLAEYIRERRTLLVLDGIEPLQHPPSMPEGVRGRLNDLALAALLRGLAQHNPGLCVVTTRERVADLAAFQTTTAPVLELQRLSTSAGVELLRALRLRGTAAEFEACVREVHGHALTLNLLGRYLARAHGGDLRRRDQVKFETADAKVQGGHAFKAMGAYERWFRAGGPEGGRALAVLHLLGLFDRPADPEALRALRAEPAIAGLTEPIAGGDDADWNLTISTLADTGLIAPPESDSSSGGLDAPIDSHPLVREYFGKRLLTDNPTGWRLAHRRLYDHFRGRAEERPGNLVGLQPLYQAILHGSQAGNHREAWKDVYVERIMRGTDRNGFFSTRTLGAYGSDLAALTCFLEEPWHVPRKSLFPLDRALVLAQVSFALRALGRLTEAVKPLQESVQIAGRARAAKLASIYAGQLSELQLLLGEVNPAIQTARVSVQLAEQGDNAAQKVIRETNLGEALLAAGRFADAADHFVAADLIHRLTNRELDLPYSLSGFRYAEWLLREAEVAAWRAFLDPAHPPRHSDAFRTACAEAARRASVTLNSVTEDWPVAIGLDRLTLGRSQLFEGLLDRAGTANARLIQARDEVARATKLLRRGGQAAALVRGLLDSAWLDVLTGNLRSAEADLDEAWQIAEPGPMLLHLVDIHLYRARLFRNASPYPWSRCAGGKRRSPSDDLASARALIQRCGYLRRETELEDAEAVMAGH